MGDRFPSLAEKHRDFIARQRIFFTASAAPGARVNISPRESGALAVLDDHTVAYIDRTGSGAETVAHLRADGRLTIMFCAFDGPPNILRLYGRGESLFPGSAGYREILEPPSTRLSLSARARSSASPLTGFRLPAATAFPSSAMKASGPRSKTGRAPRAKRGSKPIGGRKTS